MSSASLTELSCTHVNATWHVLKPTSPSISHLVQIISWRQEFTIKTQTTRTLLKESQDPVAALFFSIVLQNRKTTIP